MRRPGWFDQRSYHLGRREPAGVTIGFDLQGRVMNAETERQPLAHAVQERILAALSPEEMHEWQTVVTQAEATGTVFIALPFHGAVGTKRA